MRLHTNPKTGDPMTANMNTSEMPRFLQPSHGQIFQFINQHRSASRRKYLLPSKSTVQDLIKPTTHCHTTESSYTSTPSRNNFTQSFGHSSATMKVLMRDNPPVSASITRSYINNRILNSRKQYMVPADDSVRQTTHQSFVGDMRRSFFKPGQFSRLTGNLNKAKILMRERQPESPRGLSRFGDLNQSKRRSRFKKSNCNKDFSTTSSKLQKTSKVKSTIYDYQKLYDNNEDLNPQSLQNTMNHILAFDEMLKHVNKYPNNPLKKQKNKSSFKQKF